MTTGQLSEPEIKQIPAQTWLSCGKIASWEALPMAIGEVWAIIHKFLENNNIQATGPDSVLYGYDHDPGPVPDRAAKIFVASQWPVNKADFDGRKLGHCEIIEQEAQTCISAVYKGVIRQGLPFAQLRHFADEQGLPRDFNEHEIYHSFIDIDDPNNEIEMRCYLR